MSNRSLVRKNSNRYKSIRCLSNRLHGSLKDGTRPSEIFGSCEHPRHVPITIEHKEPLLCYTKTPTRLECVTMDLEK